MYIGYAVVRIVDCKFFFEEGLPVIELSVEVLLLMIIVNTVHSHIKFSLTFSMHNA